MIDEKKDDDEKGREKNTEQKTLKKEEDEKESMPKERKSLRASGWPRVENPSSFRHIGLALFEHISAVRSFLFTNKLGTYS